MKRKDELREIDIRNHVCYYFDGVTKDIDINFSKILLDKKIYENISVYDVPYKNSTVSKLLHINLCKIDGFIRVRGGEFIHLVLIDYELFDKICDKIKDLISEKSDINDSINHNFGEIKINSYNSLTMEKY